MIGIVKREGNIVPFNKNKIVSAVSKATLEVEHYTDSDYANEVADIVESEVIDSDFASVEDVQDRVESLLMVNKPKVAKAYIIYRKNRELLRDKPWVMTDLQRSIWDNKYQHKKETFKNWIERASGGNPRIAKRIRNKEFLFGGRILANRGLRSEGLKVTYSNCYVLPAPRDTLESIFNTARDMARTYSYGGGVGIRINNLRPRDSNVHNNAKTTSGAVSFMPIYSLTTQTIGQHGRRGAGMISLRVSSPDIEEFVDVKTYEGALEGANISIEIDNAFMIAVKEKKEYLLHFTVEDTGQVIERLIDAYALYEKIIKNNLDWAEPGVLYWDRIESHHLMSADPDFFFDGVNPCLHGDSLIQTTEGNIPIKELIGKTPDVYCMDKNGDLAIRKSSKVWLTKKNAKVVKVVSGKGEIVCTPDHKIYTTNRGWVEAKDLVKGDKLKGLNRKTTGHKYCSVGLSGSHYEKEHRFVMRHYHDIEKLDVHHEDDDGFNNDYSNLSTISHSAHSVISNKGRVIENIRDSKGKYVEKPIKTKRTTKNLGKKSGTNWFVKEVIELNESFDVYDMTVPSVHNFVANDIVVHNCAEQPLPAGGSCLLGSINLSEFVIAPFTEVATFDFTRFTECVNDAVIALNEVLDEGLSFHPLEIQRKTVSELRQIGLGIMGLANMFIKMGITYGGTKSLMLSEVISHIMLNEAIQTSSLIAKEKGSFEKFNLELIEQSPFFQENTTDITKAMVRAHGLRNSQLICIAPTGSIGTMLGIPGGLEPEFAFSHERTTKSLHGGDVTYKVFADIVTEYMEFAGITNEDELPEYFVSAHDIPWRNRIELQSVWQKHIDASISSTVNLHENVTIDEVMEIYMYAWEMGLKGCTIYRENCKRGGILVSTKGKKSEKKEEKTIGYYSKCPECESENMVTSNGCVTCKDCGFSPC